VKTEKRGGRMKSNPVCDSLTVFKRTDNMTWMDEMAERAANRLEPGKERQ